MNRKSRRAFVKNAKKKGISKSTAQAYIELREAGLDKSILPKALHEDDKVVLNVEKIKSRKAYDKSLQTYREFVEGNESVVFTVHVEKDNIYSLKENPTWLFWAGDLQKVDCDSSDSPEETEVVVDADVVEGESETDS